MNFSKTIKTCRLAAGLSSGEAAKRAGMSIAAWSNFEYARDRFKNPTLDTMVRMFSAVGAKITIKKRYPNISIEIASKGA